MTSLTSRDIRPGGAGADLVGQARHEAVRVVRVDDRGPLPAGAPPVRVRLDHRADFVSRHHGRRRRADRRPLRHERLPQGAAGQDHRRQRPHLPAGGRRARSPTTTRSRQTCARCRASSWRSLWSRGSAGVSSTFSQSGALVRGIKGADLRDLPGHQGPREERHARQFRLVGRCGDRAGARRKPEPAPSATRSRSSPPTAR